MARARRKPGQVWSDDPSIKADAGFWLYCITEMGHEETGPCKVGIATRLDTRLSSLQGGNWRQINLVWQVRLCDRLFALTVERWLLGKYRPSIYGPDDKPRLMSEWIEASPNDALKTAVKLIDECHGPIRRVA